MEKVPEISSVLRMGRVKLICAEYGYNESFMQNSEGKKIPIDFSLKPKIIKIKNEKRAIVSLELRLFKRRAKDCPIWAVIKNQAVFEWENSDAQIDSLLKTAAPAHLLSYIRPLISQLTTMSDLPALVIPLMNFSEENPKKMDKE